MPGLVGSVSGKLLHHDAVAVIFVPDYGRRHIGNQADGGRDRAVVDDLLVSHGCEGFGEVV